MFLADWELSLLFTEDCHCFWLFDLSFGALKHGASPLLPVTLCEMASIIGTAAGWSLRCRQPVVVPLGCG